MRADVRQFLQELPLRPECRPCLGELVEDCVIEFERGDKLSYEQANARLQEGRGIASNCEGPDENGHCSVLLFLMNLTD